MTTNRREFLERVGATAVLGALPLSAMPHLAEFTTPVVAAEGWDLSWTPKLKGKKHKACFDCAEVESGYGGWRASMWEGQYQAVGGAKASDIVTVMVLRHNGALLALNQDFWTKYSVGDVEKVTHPLTQQGTARNPALLTTAQDNMPAMFDAFALPKFLERGGVALACNVALTFIASKFVAPKDGVTPEEAHKRTLGFVIPGVIVQPSGVLAAVRAQQEGCVYVKAS
jgi:hypothetical protein